MSDSPTQDPDAPSTSSGETRDLTAAVTADPQIEFGQLNPISRPVIQERIDPRTATFFGTARNAAIDQFSFDSLAKRGFYKGIVLRVIPLNPTIVPPFLMRFFGDLPEGRPAPLIQIKARIPELHHALPIPSQYGAGDGDRGSHNWIIDLYPTYTSIQTYSAVFPLPSPGDIVMLDYEDKQNFEGPQYLGIYQSTVTPPALYPQGYGANNPAGARNSWAPCTTPVAAGAPSGDSVNTNAPTETPTEEDVELSMTASIEEFFEGFILGGRTTETNGTRSEASWNIDTIATRNPRAGTSTYKTMSMLVKLPEGSDLSFCRDSRPNLPFNAVGYTLPDNFRVVFSARHPDPDRCDEIVVETLPAGGFRDSEETIQRGPNAGQLRSRENRPTQTAIGFQDSVVFVRAPIAELNNFIRPLIDGGDNTIGNNNGWETYNLAGQTPGGFGEEQASTEAGETIYEVHGTTPDPENSGEHFLNLRTGPASENPSQAALLDGTQVAELEVRGNWRRVRVTAVPTQSSIEASANWSAARSNLISAGGDRSLELDTDPIITVPSVGDEGWIGGATRYLNAVVADSTPSSYIPSAYVVFGTQEDFDANATDGPWLNLREGPSADTEDIGDLPDGTIVTKIAPNNGEWSNIRANDTGQEGWVSSRFIRPNQTASQELYEVFGTSNTDEPHLNLRSSRSFRNDDNIIGRLPDGTQISRLTISGDWSEVEVIAPTERTGEKGWVVTRYIRAVESPTTTGLAPEPAPPQAQEDRYVVFDTASDTDEPYLNLRSSPSDEGETNDIGNLPDGTLLTVLSDPEGNWTRVRVVDGTAETGTEGWVFSRFIRRVEPVGQPDPANQVPTPAPAQRRACGVEGTRTSAGARSSYPARGPRSQSQVKIIVVHTTAGSNKETVERTVNSWINHGQRVGGIPTGNTEDDGTPEVTRGPVSTHFVIRADGTIVGLWDEPLNWTAWHGGNYNPVSIGIDLEGRANDTSHTQAQWDSLIDLVSSREFSRLSIIGHRHYSSKTCPETTNKTNSPRDWDISVEPFASRTHPLILAGADGSSRGDRSWGGGYGSMLAREWDGDHVSQGYAELEAAANARSPSGTSYRSLSQFVDMSAMFMGAFPEGAS